MEHLTKQQSGLIADLESQRASLTKQYEAALQRCLHLQRLGAAYSQAYGRLSAHASELHAQFAKQLGSLLHLCRHVGLQLVAVQQAADPVAKETVKACQHQPACVGNSSPSVEAAGSSSSNSTSSTSSGGCESSSSESGGGSASPPLEQWQPLVRLVDKLRCELSIAAQLLELQASSSEVQTLAGVPDSIAAALQADLSGATKQPADLLATDHSSTTASSSSAGGNSSGSSASGSGGGSSGSGSGSSRASSSIVPDEVAAKPQSPLETELQVGALAQDRVALHMGAAQVGVGVAWLRLVNLSARLRGKRTICVLCALTVGAHGHQLRQDIKKRAKKCKSSPCAGSTDGGSTGPPDARQRGPQGFSPGGSRVARAGAGGPPARSGGGGPPASRAVQHAGKCSFAIFGRFQGAN